MFILDIGPAKVLASPSFVSNYIFTKHFLLFDAVAVWVIVWGMMLADCMYTCVFEREICLFKGHITTDGREQSYDKTMLQTVNDNLH